MEHFTAVKNKEYQILWTRHSNIDIIKNSVKKKWYVVDDDGYLRGYIGGKEYAETIRQNSIVINRKFTYLIESVNDKEKAEELFRNNSKLLSIPVISKDGKLLYEYIKDYEAFYDELKIESGINKENKRDKHIVVSLTSHGKRLNTVYLAIKSIMYQTLKADSIVLFLDEGDSDKKILHEDELIEAGLSIVRNVQNLGPHTKYYQAMAKFKDSIIITVDDDILYDDTLLEELYESHLQFPDAIVCRWGTMIKKRGTAIEKYNLWEDKVAVKQPQIDVCALGVGGCLYPCGSYREKFLDREGIIKSCIGADDLWLKAIEMINGIKTISIGFHPIHTIRDTQDIGLSLENCLEERNDLYISNIQKYLNIDLCEYF